MSPSTVSRSPRWSPVTTNKINDPLGKNIVLHHQFIIILPLYALNNKDTGVLGETCDFGVAVKVLNYGINERKKLMSVSKMSVFDA